MAERTYRGVEVDLDDLADAVVEWFERDGFEVQDFQEGPSIYIQARKQSLLTTVSGTGKALTVRIAPLARGFKIEIGPGEWLDKGVGAGIALARFLWWPLRVGAGIATGYGIYQQWKLPEQLFDYVEAYVDRHGVQLDEQELEVRRPRRAREEVQEDLEEDGAARRPSAPQGDDDRESEPNRLACPGCGASTRLDSNFCHACGHDLRTRRGSPADDDA